MQSVVGVSRQEEELSWLWTLETPSPPIFEKLFEINVYSLMITFWFGNKITTDFKIYFSHSNHQLTKLNKGKIFERIGMIGK